MSGQLSHDRSSISSVHTAAPHLYADLILQQLDALPTLSSIAVRVLELTSDDRFKADEVIELIGTDPSLSAKVLKLCRCSEQGRSANVRTVDRAVLMMGFQAVRNAVLSVQVFDTLEQIGSASLRDEEPQLFDRRAFWQHSIAVACAAEALAGTPELEQQINKSEAFLAGLLHELGLLALHVTLPAPLEQACRYAELNAVGMDHACRRIIGIDTVTAGKRLAEHWQLPHAITDVIWLHGQQPELLPNLPHRKLIAVVSLADSMVHCRYIAPVDQGRRCEFTEPLQQWLGLSSPRVEKIIRALPAAVKMRADALGMSVEQDAHELLKALAKANAALGRINDHLRSSADLATQQAATIAAINTFHRTASPGGSILAALTNVATSVCELTGGEHSAILFQPKPGRQWHVLAFANDGQNLANATTAPPPNHCDLSEFDAQSDLPLTALNLRDWLQASMPNVPIAPDWRLLPLRCGSAVLAAVLHRPPAEGALRTPQLEALSRTWAAAVMAAVQHDGAKRLGEELAQANAILSETQDELARARALATIGEVAAGAAHEMNNPLTVISGRSQLLATRLNDPSMRDMAEQITEATHRLSDMITGLRQLAEPMRLRRTSANLSQLLDVAIENAVEQCGQKLPVVQQLPSQQAVANIFVDGGQFADALTELICNALEAEGASQVTVRVQIDPANDRLTVQVADDGRGLTDHALAHAFDPFFSAKPAGRQPGMGLARARRIVEAHGGSITIRNASKAGALVTIQLSQWRNPGKQRHVA